jgi:hypothetical protein
LRRRSPRPRCHQGWRGQPRQWPAGPDGHEGWRTAAGLARRVLTLLTREQPSATAAIAYNALKRAIRHAESLELTRRNVSVLVDTSGAQKARQSMALTVAKTPTLVEVASDLSRYRLGTYVVLRLQTGPCTEQAWVLTRSMSSSNADRPTTRRRPASRRGSLCQHGDTKTPTSRRTVGLRRPHDRHHHLHRRPGAPHSSRSACRLDGKVAISA